MTKLPGSEWRNCFHLNTTDSTELLQVKNIVQTCVPASGSPPPPSAGKQLLCLNCMIQWCMYFGKQMVCLGGPEVQFCGAGKHPQLVTCPSHTHTHTHHSPTHILGGNLDCPNVRYIITDL